MGGMFQNCWVLASVDMRNFKGGSTIEFYAIWDRLARDISKVDIYVNSVFYNKLSNQKGLMPYADYDSSKHKFTVVD